MGLDFYALPRINKDDVAPSDKARSVQKRNHSASEDTARKIYLRLHYAKNHIHRNMSIFSVSPIMKSATTIVAAIVAAPRNKSAETRGKFRADY
jgi:hypothetical protein